MHTRYAALNGWVIAAANEYILSRRFLKICATFIDRGDVGGGDITRLDSGHASLRHYQITAAEWCD